MNSPTEKRNPNSNSKRYSKTLPTNDYHDHDHVTCLYSEFTTMAGRRLREAVKEMLIANGNGEYNDNTHIVIAGLTNTYSQYITTYEEYQAQRYEVDLSLSLLILRFTML